MFSLHLADLFIVLVYFGLVLFVGIRFGRKNETLEGYVAGERKVPWIAVLGSLTATEISAATFLGTPGVGFASNLGYLQMSIGSLLGRFVIAFLFLTAFYRVRYLSIYQYLADRFGGVSHYTATIFFLMSRVLASAVRLMIASTGLHVILGIPFAPAMIGFALLCLIYTGIGGIRAVIWTDCVQAIVFIGAAVTMFFVLQDLAGWGNILEIARQTDHLKTFHWAPEAGIFTDSNWVVIAVFFGFITTLASMGTDHDLTQRMLTCEKVGQARRSIILNGFISLPVAGLFLMIGVGLFAYYQQIGEAGLPMRLSGESMVVDSDKVFPHFISTVLPAGLKGLLLCGILAAAMSSLDSAMAALSSSVVVDLYRPFMKNPDDTRSQVRVARIFMAVAALLLGSVAWLLQNSEGFLWLAFKISGITYSGLLGVFLVGLLSRRGNDRWNIASMLIGSITTAILLILSEKGYLNLAWQYPMLIGVTLTFMIGVIPSGLKPQVSSQ